MFPKKCCHLSNFFLFNETLKVLTLKFHLVNGVARAFRTRLFWATFLFQDALVTENGIQMLVKCFIKGQPKLPRIFGKVKISRKFTLKVSLFNETKAAFPPSPVFAKHA